MWWLTLLAGLATQAALLAPAPAAGAPTISLTSSFSTGANLDEPSVATDTIAVAGSEYEGHPLPLTGLTLGFPAGTALSGAGFATCSKATLEPSGKGPSGCPRGSIAGPPGSFSAWVAFGNRLELESGTVEPFFSPEGGLYLFLFGHEPVLVELIATGRYVNAPGGSGPAVDFEVPLVETVPGSPDASLVALTVKLGAFREEGGRRLGSVTSPGGCSGEMSWQVVGTFMGDPSAVTAEATTPCPAPSAAELEAARKAAEQAAAAKAAEEAAQKAAREAAVRRAIEAARKSVQAAFALAVKQLRSWLALHGKGAKLGQVLRSRGYREQVSIPPGSVTTVDWYSTSHGGRIGRTSTRLAAGRAVAKSQGTTRLAIELTKAGRRLLSRSRSLEIAARGTLTMGPAHGTAVRVFRLSR